MPDGQPVDDPSTNDEQPALHDQLPRRYLAIIAGAAERLLAADDPAAMVDDLFGMICEELRLDAFFNYRLDGDGLVLEAHGGLDPGDVPECLTLQLGQPVCGVVARDQRPAHITTIQASQEPELAFARRIGLDSYACTPLTYGGRLLGTLAFGRRWSDAFDADELTLLRTLSGYVAITKHRLSVEADLRRGLDRQDRLLQELNHRVRNALQLAISIVGMEFRLPVDDTPAAAKQRAVARLEVMATAHRPLYRTDHLETVDVATLLRGVAEQTVGHEVTIDAAGIHDLSVERGVALALVSHAMLIDTTDLRSIRIDHDGARLAITLVAPSLGPSLGPSSGAADDATMLPRSTALLLRQLRATIDRDASGLTLHFANG